MRNNSGSVSVYREIEIGNEEYIEVEFTGTVEEVDNGIGPYEYFGFKGFDSQPGLEVQEFEWDRSLYSDEVNEKIEKFSNEDEDGIMSEMCEKYEPYEPDYPEPEDY